MLILSRKLNEKIWIDGKICITVIEIGYGGKIRLGIEAPDSIPIYRQELISAVDLHRMRTDLEAARNANRNTGERNDNAND